MLRYMIILLSLFVSTFTIAAEYKCDVEKKFDSENTYTIENIKKWKFSVKLEEGRKESFVSRCSFSSSVNKVTCDRYKVDKVIFDSNVKIKKYYAFSSQFDLQIFSNLSFVENNGRGGVAYGKCRVIAP